MVDEQIAAGHFHGELDHRGTARRHERGLHVRQRGRCQRGLVIDPVEDLAYDMEGRDRIWASYAEEDTNRLADFRA